MSEIRAPKMCGLFKPGHNPHWIQMSRATENRENLPAPCRFIEARQDGTVVIEVDGQELHLRNHEPERLSEGAAGNGGVVQYQPRWGLLWVPVTSGRHAFSVAGPSTDHVPCPLQPPQGSPVELLESAAGFSISVDLH
jgi:hypothetical protein